MLRGEYNGNQNVQFTVDLGTKGIHADSILFRSSVTIRGLPTYENPGGSGRVHETFSDG